ncbi:unnamed protein product [Scytosiphon promiscuus]
MSTAPVVKGRQMIKNGIAVSSAMVLGDAVCQAIETIDADKKFVWDSARTMRMGITGAFLVTPASFSWNLYAERLAPGTSWRAVLTKLGVSMAVTPPMLAAQFTSLTLLEDGKDMSDVRRKLSRDFVPTLKNALLFWPLVSVLNSKFVSVLNRPVVSSFAGVFWNVYISYQANHNGMEVGELSEVFPLTEEEDRALREAGVTAAAATEAAQVAVAAEAAAVKAEAAAEKAVEEMVATVSTPAVAAVKVSDAEEKAAVGARVGAVEAVSATSATPSASATSAAALVGERKAEAAARKEEVAATAATAATAASTAAAAAAAAAAVVPDADDANATPGRKKRRRFVRRTSVVSM